VAFSKHYFRGDCLPLWGTLHSLFERPAMADWTQSIRPLGTTSGTRFFSCSFRPFHLNVFASWAFCRLSGFGRGPQLPRNSDRRVSVSYWCMRPALTPGTSLIFPSKQKAVFRLLPCSGHWPELFPFICSGKGEIR